MANVAEADFLNRAHTPPEIKTKVADGVIRPR
jgi:hypothetical protein